MLQPLYLRGKGASYLLNRLLGGGGCLESNLRLIDDKIVTSHYTNSALLSPIIIIIIIIINKRDASNNRGEWNHFKITQTILEQHTKESTKLRNYKKQPHWALTHTKGSANVKVQNIFHGRNNITCSTSCSCNTIYPRYMVCFRYIIVNNLHKGDDKDNNNNNNNNNNNRYT